MNCSQLTRAGELRLGFSHIRRLNVLSHSASISIVTTKRRKTLRALFAAPTRASIAFADIERLIVALGGEVRTGAGSRVVFELRGKRTYLHRPHPGREAKKYQVEEVREFLRSLEIAP